MQRRTQFVRGHYRTSKNGKTYWVSGHVRNDMPPLSLNLSNRALWWLFGWILAAIFCNGNGLVFWLLYVGPPVMLKPIREAIAKLKATSNNKET